MFKLNSYSSNISPTINEFKVKKERDNETRKQDIGAQAIIAAMITLFCLSTILSFGST